MYRILSCAALVCFSYCAIAAESIPDVDSHYRVVDVADGSRLQAIVTLPKDDQSPRHPLLFAQWVSCGSIEYREGSNARELLGALARETQLALVRVERSALDDTGPECADLDYETEVAHYVEAFTVLLKDPLIDPEKIYLYGSSLGSTTVALIAQRLQENGVDIAGVMVQGGGALTYFERMINFERNYLERRPEQVSAAAIHNEFLHRVRFQYEYLVSGRHPDAVAEDSEQMSRIRNDIRGMGTEDQYGRPYEWHQQASQHNFLAAWAQIDAPVLVIFNAFDQFEARHGHKLIADTVNRLRPGTATFVERPGIGHSDNRYVTIEDAYVFRDGLPAWRGAANIMIQWLRSID